MTCKADNKDMNAFEFSTLFYCKFKRIKTPISVPTYQ